MDSQRQTKKPFHATASDIACNMLCTAVANDDLLIIKKLKKQSAISLLFSLLASQSDHIQVK